MEITRKRPAILSLYATDYETSVIVTNYQTTTILDKVVDDK